MSEIIENHEHKMVDTSKFATRGQNSASLSLGIIGTALGVLAGGGGLLNLFNGNGKQKAQNCPGAMTNSGVTDSDLNVERMQCEHRLQLTKDFYEDRIDSINALNAAYSSLKEADTNNMFTLYKYSRDNYDVLNQRDIDNTFKLYEYSRNSKDELSAKISDLQNQISIMQAVRPYQDALIDCKINTNAMVADYNLAKRTCRMIQGELVLPNTPTITGFGSYTGCYNSSSSDTTATT